MGAGSVKPVVVTRSATGVSAPTAVMAAAARYMRYFTGSVPAGRCQERSTPAPASWAESPVGTPGAIESAVTLAAGEEAGPTLAWPLAERLVAMP